MYLSTQRGTHKSGQRGHRYINEISSGPFPFRRSVIGPQRFGPLGRIDEKQLDLLLEPQQKRPECVSATLFVLKDIGQLRSH